MTDLVVLILDEDRDHAATLADILQNDGFILARHHGDLCATESVKREKVNICLVGNRALGRDGFEVVRELRLRSPAGVVMTSNSADEIDAVLALEMGADDYIVRPVRPRELCARMRSVFRRTFVTPPTDTGARPLPDKLLRRVDDLKICGVLRMVTVREKPIHLTPSEFDVLTVLSASTNEVLSRERIIASARGSGHAINDRAVDGIISRLRHKLFGETEGAHRIKTVHGRGYMLLQMQGQEAS